MLGTWYMLFQLSFTKTLHNYYHLPCLQRRKLEQKKMMPDHFLKLKTIVTEPEFAMRQSCSKTCIYPHLGSHLKAHLETRIWVQVAGEGILGSKVRKWVSGNGRQAILLMARLRLWTTGIWSHQGACERVCGAHLRIISERQGSQNIYLQIPNLIYWPIQFCPPAWHCLEHNQASCHSQKTPSDRCRQPLVYKLSTCDLETGRGNTGGRNTNSFS